MWRNFNNFVTVFRASRAFKRLPQSRVHFDENCINRQLFKHSPSHLSVTIGRVRSRIHENGTRVRIPWRTREQLKDRNRMERNSMSYIRRIQFNYLNSNQVNNLNFIFEKMLENDWMIFSNFLSFRTENCDNESTSDAQSNGVHPRGWWISSLVFVLFYQTDTRSQVSAAQIFQP
jgi:hypothetical protein